MVERLVILEPAAAIAAAHAWLARSGGRVAQAYGDRVWIVEIPADGVAPIDDEPAIAALYADEVPDDTVAALVADEAGRLGIAAWNLRQTPSFRATRTARRGEGRSWGDDVEPEG